VFDLLNIGLQLFILFFSLVAYKQLQKQPFLKYNAIAIGLLSILFLINQSYNGFIIELIMFIITIIAIYISEDISNKLKRIVPFFVFFFVFLFADRVGEPIYLALAISFFSFAAYNIDMKMVKIFAIIGSSFFIFYNLSLDLYINIVTNIIGIIVLLKSYFKLNKIEEN